MREQKKKYINFQVKQFPHVNYDQCTSVILIFFSFATNCCPIKTEKDALPIY